MKTETSPGGPVERIVRWLLESVQADVLMSGLFFTIGGSYGGAIVRAWGKAAPVDWASANERAAFMLMLLFWLVWRVRKAKPPNAVLSCSWPTIDQ